MKRSPLKRRTWMNRRGKRTRLWESTRAILKRIFYRRGIVTCELRYVGCTRGLFLGFAHARKRRHLRPDELGQVLLACSSCHAAIERLPEEEMFLAVMTVIEKRETL